MARAPWLRGLPSGELSSLVVFLPVSK